MRCCGCGGGDQADRSADFLPASFPPSPPHPLTPSPPHPLTPSPPHPLTPSPPHPLTPSSLPPSPCAPNIHSCQTPLRTPALPARSPSLPGPRPASACATAMAFARGRALATVVTDVDGRGAVRWPTRSRRPRDGRSSPSRSTSRRKRRGSRRRGRSFATSAGSTSLVNNAGIDAATPLSSTRRWTQWRRVMAVNLDGVFLGTCHAVAAMPRRRPAPWNWAAAAAAGRSPGASSTSRPLPPSGLRPRQCVLAEQGGRPHVRQVGRPRVRRDGVEDPGEHGRPRRRA